MTSTYRSTRVAVALPILAAEVGFPALATSARGACRLDPVTDVAAKLKRPIVKHQDTGAAVVDGYANVSEGGDLATIRGDTHHGSEHHPMSP